MANRMTIDELKSYLWDSAVLLRTNIDAGAYKQYIFPLLFFKRICDVYDEETKAAEQEYGDDIDMYPEEELHTFLVPKGHHWNDVRQVTEDVGAAIVKAFREIERVNGDRMTGIFGDGAWTNKNRLPDRLLRDLIEHFSSKVLSLANCPEDELGQGYEYLIKQFADDSGHTAQEFYTNRTVVHLMTEMLQPQSGESVYDPTCGSAGMLISCIAHLKNQGKEWRNLKIYGQEINQLTSAIGRMNLFLHGIEDFNIANDDTLRAPSFIEAGQLQQFDLILANPPYSISQWDRGAFENDKYGRNLYGTPPQARADYAFIQHILASLKPDSGRAAILLPHGVLNRNEEKEIRKAIVQSDCVDAVIGLGRHLFYNSGLESCIVILRTNKPLKHRNSVLFIEAEKCTHKVQSQSYLFDDDITKIVSAYFSDEDVVDFSRRVSIDEILENDGNLNIKLYVSSDEDADDGDFSDNLDAFLSSSVATHEQYSALAEGHGESVYRGFSVMFDEFDRSTWRRVKLSDVATEYSERIDDPSSSDYEWYIGSDCIDGFAFTISRKQPASKIHSAQKLFKKGDYLLVRRSLYGSDFRERAPRADFDGICSADILTIREKPGTIVDGYLIAVLYSKQLWKFIVSNSTGSLTRRIKWNQLKDFEFDLPPVELQQKLVELLWAMEDTKAAYKELISKSDEFVKSQFIELFGDAKNPKYPIVRLKELTDVCSGGTPDRKTTEYWESGNIPWVKTTELQNNVLTTTEEFITESGLLNSSAKIVPSNTILIAMYGQGKTRGMTAFLGVQACTNQACACILPTDKIDMLFLWQYFILSYNELRNLAKGSNQANLNAGQIKNFLVPLPPLEVQMEFRVFVEQLDKSKFEAKQALEYITAAQKALMRQHLGN